MESDGVEGWMENLQEVAAERALSDPHRVAW
jgi:hypothetical protein